MEFQSKDNSQLGREQSKTVKSDLVDTGKREVRGEDEIDEGSVSPCQVQIWSEGSSV